MATPFDPLRARKRILDFGIDCVVDSESQIRGGVPCKNTLGVVIWAPSFHLTSDGLQWTVVIAPESGLERESSASTLKVAVETVLREFDAYLNRPV